MIGLEVSVNGTIIQVIAVEAPGFVNASITYGGKRHSRKLDRTLQLHGAAFPGDEGATFLDWPERSLAVGDEVTIRVIDVAPQSVSEAKERLFDPELNNERRKQALEHMKEEIRQYEEKKNSA